MQNNTHRVHIRERVSMSKLDASHIEQFNELLRYAFQVTESDLLEFGWDNEEIKHSKKPILENAQVLGYFDRGKLVSQIALYPMKMNIYNRIYKMGGITGVATYPEYSGIGLMADLMKEILKIMRAQSQSLSCLYPYSIPYYRSRGWEIVSDKMNFWLKDTQCPKPTQVRGMMQRVSEDHPHLIALHNAFAEKTHGCLVRDSLAWSEYWRWDVEDTIVAIYYDDHENPMGYIVYLLQNDVFKIKEMVYLNEEARHGLWGYIYAHQSMFDKIEGANYSNHNLAFLLEDGHIKESIQPHIMARIVDVEQFLAQYPFEGNSFSLALNVRDDLLEWNNHLFFIHRCGESINIYRGMQDIQEKVPLITLDIQTLVTMLLGYKRPLYLRSIGRLEADDEGINLLEEILPEGKAYFSDYF